MFGKRAAERALAERRRAARQELERCLSAITDVQGRIAPAAIPTYFDGMSSLVDLDHEDGQKSLRALAVGLAQGGAFIRRDTRLLLPDGETAVYDAPADLIKEVIARGWQGASQGISVPVGRGVRYRVGSTRGRLVTTSAGWTAADEGRLTVTTRQVVYHGIRKTLAFPFKKTLSLTVYTDGVGLGVSSRQAASLFRVDDPDTLAAVIAAAVDHGQDATIVNLIDSAAEHGVSAVLLSPGHDRIAVIKILMTQLELGMRDAKRMADRAPTLMREAMDPDLAYELKRGIQQAGGTVALEESDDGSERREAATVGFADVEAEAPSQSPRAPRPPHSDPAESQAPARSAARPSGDLVGKYWGNVLRDRAVPPRGQLLASHSRAGEWTEQLLGNLTVERLVRLANIQHNYCGPKDLRPLAPGDRSGDAELAWQALRREMQRPRTRPSGWTGAVKLLTPGAEPALAYVKTLQTGPLISVCACIVEGPYAEANRRGIR